MLQCRGEESGPGSGLVATTRESCVHQGEGDRLQNPLAVIYPAA